MLESKVLQNNTRYLSEEIKDLSYFATSRTITSDFTLKYLDT